MLKTAIDGMAHPLARLANLSFTAGMFPSRDKLGHVTLLKKKPGMSRKDPASYRPITNLSIFSKILEKLVLARLRPHVLATGNLNSLQSAYRPGSSTESAQLKVAGDIETATGNGMCTVLLSLNISAAFDAVSRAILCKRVESDFGVAGVALSWLKSFVSDRSQYVAVGLEKSKTCTLSSGVPQGSVLGPLLFAMYVSEVDAVIHSHAVQYHQ